MDWSRDGRYLLYQEPNGKNGWDLWAIPMQGSRKPEPVLRTPFSERNGQFSPDGKWIVYSSNESGANQVYIQPFPPSSGKWQVSTIGGIQPRWSRDGKEIFYVTAGRKWSATVRPSAGKMEISAPQELFQDTFVPGPKYFYDVSPDSKRFLEIQPSVSPNDPSANALIVVSNWQPTIAK